MSSVESRSSPHSVDIKEDTNLVPEYLGYTSGVFEYIAWVYIPSSIPPNALNITGPTSEEVKIEYEYTFVTTDPNGDDVYYYYIE